MTAPLPALRWLGLVPYVHNSDKTETHPLARKGDQLRTPDTGICESFPKRIVVKVFASCVYDLKETPFNTTFTFKYLQTEITRLTPSTAFCFMLCEICETEAENLVFSAEIFTQRRNQMSDMLQLVVKIGNSQCATLRVILLFE